MLTYTPSRTLNQERQTVYDDRIILQLAADKNAVVISNDQYRDLMFENAKFKKLIETRLLPYVMSGNIFLSLFMFLLSTYPHSLIHMVT
uniref:RNase NYN domain-containing protein n=1 Tax=Schistosoma mansoni TaxID=6183 RepID=A0A146MG89_SCHMA